MCHEYAMVNFNLNSGLNLRAREDRLTQKIQLITAKCQQLFLFCRLICYLTVLACQRFFDWSYEDRIRELDAKEQLDVRNVLEYDPSSFDPVPNHTAIVNLYEYFVGRLRNGQNGRSSENVASISDQMVRCVACERGYQTCRECQNLSFFHTALTYRHRLVSNSKMKRANTQSKANSKHK